MGQDLAELLSHCIRCGFCLEACPTFLETGSEAESPRGRIYLIRSADEGKLSWKDDIKEHIDLCLGCRACETACPSGVEYGSILEIARDRITHEAPDIPKRLLLESTTRPAVLKTQLALRQLLPGNRLPSPVSRIISGAAPTADLPQPQKKADLPPLDENALPAIRGEVYFLEGCAMRVLYDRVHQCSKRLLRRAGFEVKRVRQGCCGALHAHNGHLGEANALAKDLISAMDQELPIIVNSAGCGSTMKDYRKMLEGAFGSELFSRRVFDISEFLFEKGFEGILSSSPGVKGKATYHEACHLVHGQKVSAAPRTLLRAIPGLEWVDLPESDLCCGSAGIYNVTEPAMARRLLDRKWGNVENSGAEMVVMGNPGCHSWLAQASRENGNEISVFHTAEILEASFMGLGALTA